MKMKNNILFICILFIYGCEKTTNDNLLLIKDTEIQHRSFANTIENYPWDYPIDEHHLDSIIICHKNSEILKLLSEMDEFELNNTSFIPHYVFIKKGDKVSDTIYFDYNFHLAYDVKKEIFYADTTNQLKKIMFKNYWHFLNFKNYYNSTKRE